MAAHGEQPWQPSLRLHPGVQKSPPTLAWGAGTPVHVLGMGAASPRCCLPQPGDPLARSVFAPPQRPRFGGARGDVPHKPRRAAARPGSAPFLAPSQRPNHRGVICLPLHTPTPTPLWGPAPGSGHAAPRGVRPLGPGAKPGPVCPPAPVSACRQPWHGRAGPPGQPVPGLFTAASGIPMAQSLVTGAAASPDTRPRVRFGSS